jgi:hypothetical protein
MSLLHQESSELDDAARGESLTKGTSHIVWASIAAAVVVTIAIAVYVIAGEKPPVATIEIVDIWAHPMHEVTPGFDAAGSPVSQSTFDSLLVFTHVRLHNQSKGPIFLNHITTNATLSDGSVDSSFATTAAQYERVFAAYPDLVQWHNAPLKNELTIETGQTVDGTFVSAFRMAKDRWDSRKALDFDFGFRYQPSVKVTATGQVTVH